MNPLTPLAKHLSPSSLLKLCKLESSVNGLRRFSRYFGCILLLAAGLLACRKESNPQDPLGSDPEEEPFQGTPGQLESDWDNAILKSDGTVWAWGSNSTGQLGDGTMSPSETPKRIATLRRIVCIDFCEGAGVAADQDGNVWFWGNRLIWEEPPGYDTTVTIPRKISALSGTRQLLVAGVYIFLLRSDGTVWRLTWNHNAPTQPLNPEPINGLTNIKMLSGSLALSADGTVISFPEDTWIGPEWGGLGGETIGQTSMVQNYSKAYTVVLRKDSTVWAWGNNINGILGNGTYIDNPVATRLDTLKEIIAISASGGRCLALKKDGTVWFWGLVHLNLDQGLEVYQNRPTRLEGLENVAMIHASFYWPLLFKRADGSYWSYDIWTKEIRQLQI